jgi:hypothetical protein
MWSLGSGLEQLVAAPNSSWSVAGRLVAVARWLLMQAQLIAKAARGRQPLGLKGLARVAPPVALTTLSLTLLALSINGAVTFQLDFNGDLYAAGHRILHGLNPYDPHLLAAEAAMVRGGHAFTGFPSPRYPAPILVAAAPFSLLPLWVADVLFFVISAASVIGALRLLGVRDWRCIVAACVSWPVFFGIWLGNLSTLVLLGTALVWRWRAWLWPGAAALAAVVLAKLFAWPLGVWFLVKHRFRVLGLAALIAMAAAAIGWAVIGISHITDYPQLLRSVAVVGEGRGCSLVAALMSVGLSPGPARVTALVCAIGLIAAAWRLAPLPDGERRTFGLIVMAALIATPVAWAHYLVLAFVPIALLSPQFSGIWFLPMLAGLAPGPASHPHWWVSLPALAVELVLIGQLCLPLVVRRSQLSLSRVSG